MVRIGDPTPVPIATAPQRLDGRKRWIAFFDHPRGEIKIDSGAATALRADGRSLLAVGITAVTGTFDKGDPVRIVDPDGTEIGRALVNYPSDEVVRILGCKSGDIVKILGCCEYDEVVHRDNLVLI